jgi:hypothetical protein
MTGTAGRATYLVGAGISYNSGGPVFDQFWRAYFTRIARGTLGDSPDDQAVEDPLSITLFPPEQLFYRIARLGPTYKLSINTTLLKYLSGRPPNRNHFVLAEALQAGSSVWTTNYDILIEEAARTLGTTCHVLAWPDSPNCERKPCNDPHLFKPHGTFRGTDPGDQHLIYESQQVLAGLRPDWDEAFRRGLDAAPVVVAGYRGNDIDLMPVFADAVGAGAQVMWFELDPNNAVRLRHLLPTATITEGDPSHLLQQHASTLLNLLEDQLPDDPVVSHDDPDPVDLKVTCLATSILLDHFAQPEQGRVALRKSLRHDPLRTRVRSAQRLARSAAFDEPLLNLVARVVTGALRRAPLAKVRRSAWSYYLLFNETHGTSLRLGTHIQSQARRDTPNSWGFGTRVSAASHLKLLGDLEQVHAYINESALAQTSPSMRGKGAYNLLWALRNQGLISGWRQLWDDHVQRAALLDPNWAAWLQIEAADLACMLGDIDAAQATMASAPLEFPRRRRQHSLLLVDADTSRARTDALIGAPTHETAASVDALIERVLADRELRTPYRLASLQLTRASLEAPTASSKRNVQRLLKAVEVATPSALHLVLVGLLRHRHGLPKAPSVDEMLASCRSTGFGYGEALVTEELGAQPEMTGACEYLKERGPRPAVLVVP